MKVDLSCKGLTTQLEIQLGMLKCESGSNEVCPNTLNYNLIRKSKYDKPKSETRHGKQNQIVIRKRLAITTFRQI